MSTVRKHWIPLTEKGKMLSTVRTGRLSPRLSVGLAVLVGALAALVPAAPAAADVEWRANVSSAPSNMVPGERAGIMVWPANKGSTPSSGFPTITVALPAGVTFAEAGPSPFWACAGTTTVTCSLTFPLPVAAFAYTPIPLSLVVNVDPSAATGTFPVPVTLEGSGAAGPVIQNEEIAIANVPTEFGIVSGSFLAGAFEQNGDPSTQAGGHPYQATAAFKVKTKFNDPADQPDPSDTAIWLEMVEAAEHAKDVIVDVPRGFVGDATAVPKCVDLQAVADQECPPGSQVGVVAYDQRTQMGKRMAAIYNMEPDDNLPAQFAFDVPLDQPVTLVPVVRSDGDWGLSIKARDLNEGNPIFASSATLWGVPADPSHNDQRCALPNEVTGTCVGVDSNGNPATGGDFPPDVYDPHPPGTPPLAFLTNPTECTGDPVTTLMHISGWSNPAPFEADGDPLLSDSRWKSASDDAPALEGCESLGFDPTVKVQPTATTPDSPTGLEFELTVPQNDDLDGVATAHLRDTSVVLPEGMTVNASSADGLAACSSAEIGLTSKSPVRFTRLEPSCPAGSKLGTVEIDTPLLEEPISGSVHLAAQKDNPFDSLLAIYIVVRGPGILGKLAGHVTADPVTGRLTTTVVENPQLPFDSLRLRIKGGPRAPLTTPATCGTKTATADLTSWAGHAVQTFDTFQIDCPGNADRFEPGFSAGATSPVGGEFSPFVTRITRDGGKELGSVDVTLPKGALASLKHVDVCSEAQIASAVDKAGRVAQGSPSCPIASQVGTTTVGAGAGPNPFFPTIPGSNVSGRVFLTGPHTGTQFPIAGARQAAYGLAIEVPAVAGPFDIGTVMVRAAIYVDPATAQLRVISDRVPRVLTVLSGTPPNVRRDGVVLNVRDIRVDIDRAGFTLNPSSCAEKQVVGDIHAQDGTTVQRTSRFQVGDCAALRFKPRLGLRLTGRRQVTTGKHPGVRALVRQTGVGEAGVKRAVVRLPKSLALDPDNAQALCEFADGTKADLENRCPKGSIVGRARAVSPLLKRPLTGNVYFVKNIRIDRRTGNQIRTLPMIVVALRGEVAINLRGVSSTTRDGRLVNTFAEVPDAPISQFNLNIAGGSNGILAVTRTSRSRINLCSSRQVAKAVMNGQNGKRRDVAVTVKTPCPKKKATRGVARAKR